MANLLVDAIRELRRNYSDLSREARLMLARVALYGLATAIWTVIFNLYLLSLGFDAAFIAKMVSMKWWFHGAFVLPAGILSDLYGRRKTFLIATVIAVLLNIFKLGTAVPQYLLLLNATGGVAESFQIATSSPMLMEHSRTKERIYLFSFYTFFMMAFSTAGHMLGGALPGFGGMLLGLGSREPGSFRFALAMAIPILFVSIIPIYLIKEEWRKRKLSAWWKGIKSWRILGVMAASTGLTGLAIGLTFPFYNIFFARHLGASTSTIGMIFAAGSLAGALGTSLAPAVESRLGKVNTITAARLLSVPFLIGMALVPMLAPVALFYLMRRASMSVGFPVRALFRMEVVEEQERGTTTGIVHAMADIPIVISSWMAGGMMARGDWLTPYSWASVLLVASAAIFFFYFRPMESRLSRSS
jgi:MFS family permease